MAAVIVAVMQRRSDTRQQCGKPRFALDQRQGGDVLAVAMQQVEDEIHQPRRVARVGRGLDHAERRDAVGKHAAQFTVEISLARVERRHRRGDRRIFMGPVEPGAGQQFHRAAIEPGVHAVTVEFDLVEPLIALRRRVDELGELRRDPFRQGGGAALSRYRPRHAGSELQNLRMRLFERLDLADMPGGVGELEADALAMPAGRKAAALDHRDFVRHVGMRRIVCNRVDAGLRDDLAGFEFLCHGWPRCKVIDDP